MEVYSLKYVKSKYILKNITEHLTKDKLLKIIKYNKLIQNQLDIGIFDYKKYYEEIEIELIPINKNDINYFNKNDNITKINIILGNEIKSFKFMFEKCKCIEKIKFIKFKRNDINNMRGMFYRCQSLKELNLNNFNTINVTNMSCMFFRCSEELKTKIRIQYENLRNATF